jgi:hypothetical protein
MAIEPVHQGESGAKVATLHRGLLYLIRNQRGIIAETRNALEQMLANDVATQSFGWATTSAVGIFQYQFVNRRDIPKEVKKEYPVPILRKDDGTGNGDVDDATAGALNWLVRETRAAQKKFVSPALKNRIARPKVLATRTAARGHVGRG